MTSFNEAENVACGQFKGSIKAGFHQRPELGVGIVSGVIRTLVRAVTSAMESEELESFHFFRPRLRLCRLHSAYDLIKTRLSESEAEAEG